MSDHPVSHETWGDEQWAWFDEAIHNGLSWAEGEDAQHWFSSRDELMGVLRAVVAIYRASERVDGYELATMERLLAKAKRWKARGMFTDDQWAAIAGLLWSSDPEDMTEEKRYQVSERGRAIAERLGLLATPTKEKP